MYINKKKINENLLNFLIFIIPLSLILGNLIINVNIILICLVGLTFYKFQIFKFDQKIYKYLIYSFFLYLILITLFRNIPNLNNGDVYKENIIKSIFFLRFLILFLVINKLVEEKSFNLKFFFISCAFFSFIVSFDIIIQAIYGKNLLNYPITLNRPSGFFGNENIAGGYIQKFSFFFIFLLPFILLKNNYRNLFFIGISVIFFLTSIMLTANRMSFIIFILSICLSLLITKKFKEILTLFLLSFIIFSIGAKFLPKERFKTPYNVFLNSSVEILSKAPKIFYYNSFDGEEIIFDKYNYLVTFNSGVQVWKKNKIFGGGLKSFKLNCTYDFNQTCNTHPHNYLIEIMVDTGIVGSILISLIFVYNFLNFIKFLNYNYNYKLKSTLLSFPFFLIFFFEFFPFRSSGSFFTTNNAVIIFFVLGILLNISKLNFFENKKL
jgi:O-antigen ligase